MGIDKVNGVVEVYIFNKMEEAKKTGELNLSFCNLVSLPEPLFELTNLQKLNLQHNYFTALPERIKELASLTELNLELNQIAELPLEIGQLVNLQKLNLKNNRLTSLTPAISQLANLIELDVSGNQLTDLPPEIVQLTGLRNIYIQGNPLQTPPLEIAERGMAAIIAYFNNFSEAALPLTKPDFVWNSEGNLRYEYNYKRAARMVMNLFIERQQKQQQYETVLLWRSGVVLFREDTRALIELDAEQSRIIIQIDGPTRRGLLQAIRKELHEIHETVGMTDVKELVSCNCSSCALEPHMFNCETLKKFLANGQYKTICAKSSADVAIADLLDDIEDLAPQETADLFEGWRPASLGDIKFIVQKNEVIVLHGRHAGSRYSFEQLNQIIYEILKKKIQTETERLNMFENLQIIKNPCSDKNKRPVAVSLFKVLIQYLAENGEHVLAGFLYEALKCLPYIKN